MPPDRVFIIAEAGINHCGDWLRALDLVDAAHAAGADAVKFQIYHADTMLHGDRKTLKACELSDAAHRAVKAHCDEIGIQWMASCFDEAAVDLCVELGASIIKVGSGEITNLPLMAHIGRTGRRLILSTGMSELDDIFQAVAAFKAAGGVKDDLALLHCVSNYPTSPQHCNLKAMFTLRRNFTCPVGFSDHTAGLGAAAVAAVAMGASIIEKHFTVRPDCPDAAVSLSAEELRVYVAAIRNAESMLGTGEKVLQPGELQMLRKARGRWYRPEAA